MSRTVEGATDGSIREKELLSLVEMARSFGWEVVAYTKAVRSPKDFNISVASGIDWFDVNVQFNFEGFSESLPQLISAIKSGQKLYNCVTAPLEFCPMSG